MRENVGVNRQLNRQQNRQLKVLVVYDAARCWSISVLHRNIGSDDVDGYSRTTHLDLRPQLGSAALRSIALQTSDRHPLSNPYRAFRNKHIADAAALFPYPVGTK
jgi:hypothetical protein